MAMESLIKVHNLTVKFGKVTILNNINFEINKGEIFGKLRD